MRNILAGLAASVIVVVTFILACVLAALPTIIVVAGIALVLKWIF